MKLHNRHTVVCGKDVYVSYNAMSGIGDALARNEPYAQYVLLYDSLAGDGQPVFCAPVEITDRNADCVRGELFADYTVTAFGEGLAFDRIALATDASGSMRISESACERIRCTGEPVFVTVRVYVEVTGEGVKPTGGENPLVLWLLGCGKLSGEWHLHEGQCYRPDVFVYRTTDGLRRRTSASMRLTKEGVEFSAMPTASAAELVLTTDGKPVLRARKDFGTQSGVYTGYPQSIHTISAIPAHPVTVFNVSQNNRSITNVKLIPLPQTAVRTDRYVPFTVGTAGELQVSPDGRYMAAIAANDLLLLRLLADRAEIVCRLNHEGQTIIVCDGGVVALWGDELTLHEPVDGEYRPRTIALSRGSRCALVREGTGYHAAHICDGRLQRYRIAFTSESPVTLQMATASAGMQLFRNRGRICWGGTDTTECGCATLVSSNADIAENLRVLFSVFTEFRSFRATDYFAYVDDGKGYRTIVDYVNLYEDVLDDRAVLSGGRAYCRQTATGAWDAYVFHPLNGTVAVREIGSEERPVTAIEANDERVFFLYADGSIDCYTLEGQYGALYSPDFVSGEKITYTVTARKAPVAGGGKTVKIGLRF